jgi:hypothetical protein
MENLGPSALKQLFENGGNPTVSLFPEALVTAITTALTAMTIIGVLFLVVYVFGLVRKWKVDSAILTMQKDIHEIKESLGTRAPQPPEPTSPPQTTEQ